MTYSSNYAEKDTWVDGNTPFYHDHVASIYDELGPTPGADIAALEGYPFALVQVVATGSEARPSGPNGNCKVIWIGGTAQPDNMASGDLWFKDTP